MRLGVLPLARRTFDVPFAEQAAARAIAALEATGAELIGPPALLFDAESAGEAAGAIPDDVDLLVVLQVTFSDSTMIEAVVAATKAPLALWAFPEERTGGRLRLNSFCGINLAAFALRRAGRDYRWILRDPADEGAGSAVAALAAATPAGPGDHDVPDASSLDPDAVRAAADVAAGLSGARVGVIGAHPDGFEPCAYDRDSVRALTGVTVDRLELEDLFGRAESVGSIDEQATRGRLSTLGGLEDVDQEELSKSLRLYPALTGLAGERGLSGMAVRCWPEAFTEYGAAVCSPASLMNDDGLPTACEADVYGSITALVLQALTGSAPLVADMVDVDVADDSVVLWHCGKAPLSMADPGFAAAATVHSNRKKPLLNEFPFKPGRVTVARLSQAGGRHTLVVGGGEMLERPLAFGGTAGVIRFDTPASAIASVVMDEGLEHHFGFAYGDVREQLQALAALWGIPAVAL